MTTRHRACQTHSVKLMRAVACLIVAGVAFNVQTSAVAACSCIGDPVQTVELGGMPDVAFVGMVVESGGSSVTAEESDPPQPGLALRFEVETVRIGELGSSVVVHTPGGPAGNGNCSVGVVSGKQLVMASRDDAGQLTAGMCSIFPIADAPDAAALTELLGPERSPDPAIASEQLNVEVAPPAEPGLGLTEVAVVAVATAFLLGSTLLLARRARPLSVR